jgi:hypothetical protein
LRRVIDESVAAQTLLLEAHDIVGAANMILLPSQVNYFNEMEELETAYATKCLAWLVLRDVTQIDEQLLSSRLCNINTFDLNSKFVFVLKSFDYLKEKLDDQSLLVTLSHRINAIAPKVELVAYLSSSDIRSRHWLLIGKHVLRYCGLDLKFSGKQSEFVSLLDVTRREEPVGLGNINRLMSKELFTR